jgi:hypothetical protein
MTRLNLCPGRYFRLYSSLDSRPGWPHWRRFYPSTVCDCSYHPGHQLSSSQAATLTGTVRSGATQRSEELFPVWIVNLVRAFVTRKCSPACELNMAICSQPIASGDQREYHSYRNSRSGRRSHINHAWIDRSTLASSLTKAAGTVRTRVQARCPTLW